MSPIRANHFFSNTTRKSTIREGN